MVFSLTKIILNATIAQQHEQKEGVMFHAMPHSLEAFYDLPAKDRDRIRNELDQSKEDERHREKPIRHEITDSRGRRLAAK